MSEITAFEINLEGQFSNHIVVREVKVFTTKEEAVNQAKETAKMQMHLTYKE